MYDFETVPDRKAAHSIKWDIKDGELPMWIADMDFQLAPEIKEDLMARVQNGSFGYSHIPDEWYDAYINRWEKHHGLKIKKDELSFCTGVLPAISSAVRSLTMPGENVVLLTPVYNMFFDCIENNGRNAVESPMIYQDYEYSIDFDDLESKLENKKTTMLIFCNPHNPIGKAWDKATISKVGELCARHGAVVISDEIHCDICDPGVEYVPFASVNETCKNNCVTCFAPTKAFNMAEVYTAAVFIPNSIIRNKVFTAMQNEWITAANVFAVTAAISAFTRGKNWLSALKKQLYKNKTDVIEFVEHEIPSIKVVPSNATYLLWIDCTKIGADEHFASFLREKTGLFLLSGADYRSHGKCFLRMNVACPNRMIRDGLERLKKGVEAYQNR